jgi:tetratricopeptide (TPR) repeat protein
MCHMQRMLTYPLIGCATLIACLAVWSATARVDPRERIDYWRKNYEELSPRDDPRAHRAHKIFNRVLNAAGQRPGVVPRLFITKTDPWNIALPIALPDGWVVLSQGALDIAYRDPQRGDDRLAFVLAHEIAHQLKDDFWHMKFFQAIDASKAGDPQQDQILEEVRSIAGLTEKILAKELEADEHGIVYAAMAGFHTEAIVNEDDRVNFFETWLQAIDPARVPGSHTDSSHPNPLQRAVAVKARLRQILAQVDLFDLGLRLYQAGDYPQAIRAFEEFLRFFPSREVYHNLAASHHQLALKYARLWENADPALGYKLSLTLDPMTRAKFIALRGTRSPGERFSEALSKAIEFYQTAIALDPSYLPSYNNLGCALLLREDAYKAIATLQDALKIDPSAVDVLNNLGIAFVFADLGHTARAFFYKAHELDKAYDAPLFNLGKLAHAEQNDIERQKYWQAYLQLDSTSAWAKAIQEMWTLKAAEATSTSAVSIDPEHMMGLRIGAFRDDIPSQWGKPVQVRHLPLSAESYELAVYKNGVLTLVQDREIRLIVTQEGFQGRSARGIALGSFENEVRTRYGAPSRLLHMTQGSSWIYDALGIAFQFRDGKVISWQLF